MISSKKLLFSLVVISISLLVVIIFVNPKESSEERTVKIAIPPHLIASLPHWIAEDRRLYQNQGLEIRVDTIVSSKSMVDALYSGEVDVLPAVSLKDVLVANEKRSSENGVVFFSHSRMKRIPPFENILVPTGTSINKLSDLEGKTIAVYPGGTSRLVVLHYLKSNGVNIGSVNIIELPPTEHFSSMSRGDVDASHSYEPIRTQLLSENSVKSLSDSLYASLNDPSAIGVSVVNKNILKQRPEVAKKIFDIWDQAIEIIRSEPSYSAEVLSLRLKINNDVARKATWVDATKTDELDPEMIQLTGKSLKDAGVIDFSPALREAHFIKRAQ